MQIRRVRVERYRGVETLTLLPTARNVLIGQNNAGKSTVLEALDLALHPGLGRPRAAPEEIDYYDRSPEAGFRIEVVIGALTDAFRADCFQFLEGWSATSNDTVPEPDGEGVEPIVRVQVRGTGDFDLIHEFAKPDAEGARFSPRYRSQLGWVFDGRSRDASRQMAFYQGGLLDQLFRGVDAANAVEGLRNALGEGALTVNRHPPVAAVLAGLRDDLASLGLVGAQSPAFEAGAVSVRELLQTLRLAMPGAGDQRIPLARQGRGVQRLVLLAVLLRVARSHPGSVIGAFEEPEEALEPLRQSQAARLLAEVAESGGQVFIATHSPDILRAFALEDVMVMQPAGRDPRVLPLASLTSLARHGYERHIEGPLSRALFAPTPLLVEGPSDVAVFAVFWDHLVSLGLVKQADQLGIELIPCEGNRTIPKMAQVLDEAGKNVISWLEMDDVKAAQSVVDGGHLSCLLTFEADPLVDNLEKALVAQPSVAALAMAMESVAKDRGDDWAAQLEELKRRSQVIADGDKRKAIGAAEDIQGALLSVDDAEARALVLRCLIASGSDAVFEIKGRRAARVFAETIVATDGEVPRNFRVAFEKLNGWAIGAKTRGERIEMART